MTDRHKQTPTTLRLGEMKDKFEKLHAKHGKEEKFHAFLLRGIRYALDNWKEWVKR